LKRSFADAQDDSGLRDDGGMQRSFADAQDDSGLRDAGDPQKMFRYE